MAKKGRPRRLGVIFNHFGASTKATEYARRNSASQHRVSRPWSTAPRSVNSRRLVDHCLRQPAPQQGQEAVLKLTVSPLPSGRSRSASTRR